MMISDERIDGGKAFDWGLASKEYALYRDIYPAEFYERITGLGLCIRGQTVLDLGTGTGVLPRNLYRWGAAFVGADISENQIEQARALSLRDGLDIQYVVASAESVDFPPGSFDVVTACQCFIYFDQAKALPKIHDLLKPDGHFCILWMAWLPEEDEIAGASEALILKHNPSWTGGGYKRPKLAVPDWSREWFVPEQMIGFDIHVAFTRESWHGRMLACRGIGASSLLAGEIASFEDEHK